MTAQPTRALRSAGGVVCDDREDGRRWVLLIVHRNPAGVARWTLPKGGIEPGESTEDAALREVREETGHGAVLDRELGAVEYSFYWRPDAVRYHKTVHLFLMWWDRADPGERDDEAEHVEWVPLDIALIRLTHRSERDLVRQVADAPAPVGRGSAGVPTGER